MNQSILTVLALGYLFQPILKVQSQDSEFIPPARLPQNRYTSIWANSPFELEAAPENVVAQTKEIPKNDYVLAGVMKRGENYVAYIQNRKTGAVVKALETPNPSGFLLKEVTKSETAGEFNVTVERLGQLLTLSYDRSSTKVASKVTRGAAPLRSRPKADINPAKLALERARQQAAAKVKPQPAGQIRKTSRTRTIFVPK